MSLIDDIKTDEFEARVLQSVIPVFVDFHAVWCGPCKAMAPALDDMAREFEGEIRIVKIDVDAEPALAEAYAVQGVPTFIMIKGGAVQERFSGGMTRGALSTIFERFTDGGQ